MNETVQTKKQLTPSNSRRWAAIIMVVFFLLSLALNFYQYRQSQPTQQQLADLQQQNELLSNQLKELQSKYDQKLDYLTFLRDTSIRRITLNGTDTHLSEEKEVWVFWNETKQFAYIDAAQLPEPPEGKVYQLWRLSSLQPLTPHDAGLLESFSESDDKIFGTQVSGPTAAFAITLEPEGGSEHPTLEQLYVLGQV